MTLIKPIVKIFIEDNIYLIEDEKWEEFFQKILESPAITLQSYNIWEILFESDINPFKQITNLKNKDLLPILESLGEIVGKQPTSRFIHGKYISEILKELNNSNITTKDIIDIAKFAGYDVYETPVTPHAYTLTGKNYLILNPFRASLEEWCSWIKLNNPNFKYNFNEDDFKRVYVK